MESSVETIYLLILVAFLSLWLLLDHLYAPKHNPREPPVLSSSIPYIGHILGLLRYGHKYYQTTRYHSTAPL
jgi:hypothetical protein